MKKPQDFTNVELKAKLKERNLSTSGNKAELLARMMQADPEGNWLSEEAEDAGTQLENSSALPGTSAQQPEVRYETDQERTSVGPTGSVQPTSLNDSLTVEDLWRRERELLHRELDLARRENEFLRRSSVSPASGSERSRSPPVNITAVSSLLCEYSGVDQDFGQWERQLRLLRDSYALDDGRTRILIGSRLKGKALEWLHSKPEHLQVNVDELLRQMRAIFDCRVDKVELRRKVEARKWQVGESFQEYYYDKLTKANAAQIPEDELVKYIIEGLPDLTMQDNAKMQNYSSVSDMLSAFKQITLRPERKPQAKTYSENPKVSTKDGSSTTKGNKEASTVVRCQNCNKTGHLTSNCRHPKREKGSCYRCGEFGHMIKDCTQKQLSKKEIGNVNKQPPKEEIGNVESLSEENEFQRNITYQITKDNINYVLCLSSLLDTGSPISFVKDQFVKKLVENLDHKVSDKFYGINRSKLIIKGTLTATVTLDGQTKENLLLYVVPDDTMAACVVLGRDVLSQFRLRLTNDDVREESEAVNAIMNINVKSSTDNEADLLDINAEIPDSGKDRLKEIFLENYVKPERPEIPETKAELKLTLNNTQPFYFQPRRLSHSEKGKLRVILDTLIAKKIIRPSDSEYASRIVLVDKKNGEKRKCVDYRILNKYLARDNHPLPLIEDQLTLLNNKKYFSRLDLKDGFFHIAMAEESIKYTAFTTPLGHYEYLKMPFGLKVGPARFQRFIQDALRVLIDSGDVAVYLDDILVITEALEHHLKVLKTLFRLLVRNKMELRLDKCKFASTSIDYLGYLITGKGIQPTANGIAAVANFPIPRNLKEVHSFIGLSSYFRKFIEKFAVLAKPLNDLMKAGATFMFGAKELEAFETIKRKLISAPILAIYSPHDPTEIHCDASSVGFGAILMQRKADMKFHPVFYFSKRTSEVESRYHSFELEALAVIYALRRFRVYIYGLKFKIVTDCESLKLTLNKKDVSPRIARWALELQSYDYEVEHRIGTKMQHVDALSRVTNIMVIEDNTLEFNLSVCQSKDSKILSIRENLEKNEDQQFEMRNGLVYKKYNGTVLFYVPETMETNILHRYHDGMGHLGIEKTMNTIRCNYWFPKMKQKVETYIRNCLKCIAYSPNSGKKEGYLHSVPKGNVPFQTLHIDHYGPVDKKRLSKQHVFLVVDAFTKHVRLYATKTTSSAEVIRCLTDYFTNYSRPRIMVSDRGTAYTSREFREFLAENDVQHQLIATGSPQANGQVERVNRVLTPILAKLTDNDAGKYWYRVLSDVEFALNNSVNKSTGETPSKLLFGLEQRGKIRDEIAEYLSDNVPQNHRSIEAIRNEAADKIVKSQEQNEHRVNQKRKGAHEYQQGDLVMIRNFDSTPGAPKKLLPQFKGPYVISKELRNNRYVIADIDGFQHTNKPYQGVWESCNMRPWISNDSP